KNTQQHVRKLNNRRFGTGSDLKNFAADTRLACAQLDCTHQITNIDKVAGLFAVAVNFPSLAVHGLFDELGDNAAFVARTGPIDITEAQRYGFDPESTIIGRAIAFAGEFARPVG